MTKYMTASEAAKLVNDERTPHCINDGGLEVYFGGVDWKTKKVAHVVALDWVETPTGWMARDVTRDRDWGQYVIADLMSGPDSLAVHGGSIRDEERGRW